MRRTNILVLLVAVIGGAVPAAADCEKVFLVKDIDGAAETIVPGQFVDLNGTLYFTADDGAGGVELWRSNGLEHFTVRTRDIFPGGGSSQPSQLTAASKLTAVFFTADDGEHGVELWMSGIPRVDEVTPPNQLPDVAERGTTLVLDIEEGSASSSLSQLTDVGQLLFFVADDGMGGSGLWRTDGKPQGSTDGTFRIATFTEAGFAVPRQLTAVFGMLYFTLGDGPNAYELWKSDGTTAGTLRVETFDEPLQHLAALSRGLFFSADDGEHGVELWKSHGSSVRTVQVKEIHPSGSSHPANLKRIGSTLFFTADDGEHGVELWRTDGTEGATLLVKDVNPGTGESAPSDLTDVNGVLFFLANDGDPGIELWKSDGTPEGTVPVEDFGDLASLSISQLSNVNGTLYFTRDDVQPMQLWKSDGTTEGTEMILEAPDMLVQSSGGMLFVSTDDGGGTDGELWAVGDPPIAFLDAFTLISPLTYWDAPPDPDYRTYRGDLIPPVDGDGNGALDFCQDPDLPPWVRTATESEIALDVGNDVPAPGGPAFFYLESVLVPGGPECGPGNSSAGQPREVLKCQP